MLHNTTTLILLRHSYLDSDLHVIILSSCMPYNAESATANFLTHMKVIHGCSQVKPYVKIIGTLHI